DHVAHLPRPQLDDTGVIARTLNAVIARQVFAVTVTIVLAIDLVVFVIVRDQIIESEAVVRGQEVDGSPWASTAFEEEIGGGGHSAGERAHLAVITAPKRPHVIAKAVIP